MQARLPALLVLAIAAGSWGSRASANRRGASGSQVLSKGRTDADTFESMCPMSENVYTYFPNGSAKAVEHRCPDAWYRASGVEFLNVDYYQYDNNFYNGGGMILQNFTGFSEGLGTSNGTAYVENLVISGTWAYTNTVHQKEVQPMPLVWTFPYMNNNISKVHEPRFNAQCQDGNSSKTREGLLALQKQTLRSWSTINVAGVGWSK